MGYKQINARRRGMNTLSQAIMGWAMQKDKMAQQTKIAEIALQKEKDDREHEYRLMELEGKIEQASAGEKGAVKAPLVGKYFKQKTKDDKTITPAYLEVDGKKKYVGFWAGGTFKTGEMPLGQNFDFIEGLAKNDPDAAYALGYKMTDDGNLFKDDQTGSPVKLPPFTDAMGKRGQVQEVKLVGELYDDAKHLKGLLIQPEVKKNLGSTWEKAKKAGIIEKFVDTVTGKISNEARLWMQEAGIHPNSPTGEALIYMQKIASDQRKQYLGTAVTGTELKSSLAWMPSASDSYDTMIGKINVLEKESEQSLRHWLSLYENIADMSPFYKTFGIKRFGIQETTLTETKKSKYNNNDPLEIRR